MRIKQELKDVQRTRHLQRRNRSRGETPTIALVGYTNAGKSTLFNVLTGADVLSKDMLFATLDPTMRQTELPSGRSIVLADTVGFISQLPTELIEAFKSTLEEVVEADLLLHVHDSSSDVLFEEAEDVRQVLLDIGVDEERLEQDVIHVMNKQDKSSADLEDAIAHKFPHALFTSAITKEGVEDVRNAVEGWLSRGDEICKLTLPPAAGQARAWLYERGDVRASDYDDKGHLYLEVCLAKADKLRFERLFPELAMQTS